MNYYNNNHNVNVNTFCKCKHDTFLRKKSCREMKREKIFCRAFRREKNILPTRLLEKKSLLTRNHPPPPPPQVLNGRPLNVNRSERHTFLCSKSSGVEVVVFDQMKVFKDPQSHQNTLSGKKTTLTIQNRQQ